MNPGLALLAVQEVVDDLSPLALAILEHLGSHDDYGYYGFKPLQEATGRDRAAVKAAVDELRKYDLVTFSAGLTTEDGEMRGSGYARNDGGMRLMAIYNAIEQSLAIFRARAA